MAPTATTTVTATVAIITDEDEPLSSGGPATGHVVLGVIGGLVLVLIVVFVTVPLLRSRLYGKPRRAPSEKTQSRASSRRTHIRIPSGREVVEPLLDGQGKHLSVTGQWHGADRKDVEVRNGKKPDRGGMDEKAGASKLSPDTPIRPPSAVFNWKILTTLPNFSDESLSSLGEPLEPGASNLSKQPKASTSASNPPPPPPKQDVPTLEIITATNTTASTSRQSTLVAGERSTVALVTSPVPLSPDATSPLTHAFSGPASSSASINTLAQSTFRYPSLSPSIVTQGASSSGHHNGHSSNGNHDLPSGASGPAGLDAVQTVGKNGSESWWHMAPPMPSIPESSRSPSTPSSSDTPDNRASTGTARLRELFVAAAPPASFEPGTSSGHLQVASQHTQETSGGGRAPRLSMAGSIIETALDNSITRQSSAQTHYTFGRPNSFVVNTPASESFIPFTAPAALPAHPPSGIIPDQNSVPFPASPSSGQEQSFEAQQQRARQQSNVQPRSRFSTATQSSSSGGDPPEDTGRRRQSYNDYPREPSPPLVPTPLAHPPSRPSPVLKPQAEFVESSASASTSAPLRTPKLLLRPVSPLEFDDTLFSVSRTPTPAPGSGAGASQQAVSASATVVVPILPPPPPGKKRRARRKSTSSSSYSEHSAHAASGSSSSGGSLKSRRSASVSQRMSRRVTFGIPPDSATRATFAEALPPEGVVPAMPNPPLPFVEPLRLSSPRRPTFSRTDSQPWSVPTSPTRPVGARTSSGSPTSPISPSGARRAIRPLPIPPLSPGTSPPLASPPFASLSRNEEEQPLISALPDYDSSI